MPVDFYNVKTRKTVSIADEQVSKTKYERTAKDGSTQYRYAFRATDPETSTKLTKFVNKETWDNHPGKEE
jgi:hypothetical protein